VGLPPEFADQPVGRDRGMALEESQSLLMEMVIGRSRPFVKYLKPLLEKHFGVSGPEWSEANLYAHLTRVKRGPIRVDADELTYTLHIQLRYELENQLLDGRLAVRNLRDAWNAGMEQRLSVTPRNDVEGVLQDVHWAVGSFGYFPSYGLGAVMAAQMFDAMRAAVPEVEAKISRGEFGEVMGWLRENVHRQGARVSAQDLLKNATGKSLSAAAALRYLEGKYLEDEPAVGSAAA
jgi:carboxypeptidase Taq